MDKGLSPWLLQESFNTVCATTIIVVEESAIWSQHHANEQQKVLQGILDLLLHIMTTPQSSVTHLRAVGVALKVLDRFGTNNFLEVTGDNIQHWIRVIIGLLNSSFLSVRSIAVDFVISLLGSAFDLYGHIDDLLIIFATIMPEVAAREVALQSVSGNVHTFDDISRCMWPLRRSLADIEATDTNDDDRVDVQLSPILSQFCRTCQAILDGVLVELRLMENPVTIAGVRISQEPLSFSTFDADEESLFESASFFMAETSPLQRLRWLTTLRRLHERKKQWVEAAETMMLCARTLTDGMSFARNVWRPTRFSLWSDSRRSLWLDTVGEDVGLSERGNAQVMAFAESFLEPESLLGTPRSVSATGKLPQPTGVILCDLLMNVVKDAMQLYLREEGMEEVAYSRIESLQRNVMSVLDENSLQISGKRHQRRAALLHRRRNTELEASLRKVIASISGDITSLAARLTFDKAGRSNSFDDKSATGGSPMSIRSIRSKCPYSYVLLHLYGKKPARFEDSTALPTFLEWDSPCICRVPESITNQPAYDPNKAAKKFTLSYAKSFVAYLQEVSNIQVVLKIQPEPDPAVESGATYLLAFPVEPGRSERLSSGFLSGRQFKRFVYDRKTTDESSKPVMVETTVAHSFPCALSRQRLLFTTEYLPS
jgi:hypothetical protein